MNNVKVFSYGGGVQSTAALVLAARGLIDYKVFVFSNVGDDSEHPATLKYIREVAIPYAEKHGIEIVWLDPKKQSLYTKLMEKPRSVGIPVRMKNGFPARRACTSDYKVRRVVSFVRSRGATKTNPATVGLGISLDEMTRMRTHSGNDYEVLDYPLVTLRLSRSDCVAIIESEGLPVPPKSSCWFCPFHSPRAWQEMYNNEKELFEKAVELEAHINKARQDSGRNDKLSFHSYLIPLDQAVQAEQTEMDFDDTCESGYCMT